ncbi:uncharacterized protein PAF06_002887 [Gastrophryne carolinensis]
MAAMRTVHTLLPPLLLLFLLTIQEGKGLQCFSCVGSNDQECNRQGTQECPREADACAIIRGQSGGVTKSCSFKSFCDRAMKGASRASGVNVQCCFSNNCNSGSQGSSGHISGSYVRLIGALVLCLCILIIS